jgi:acyl-CoA thioester hydrolase
MKIRIYYEDTDTGGIVYHSNYLNFCERARSEVFFNRGITPELENGHFVAKKIIADYLKPAKLGDLLDIKTEILEMRNASFSLKQTVYKDDVKLFELVITLAYISFEGKPQKLSEVKDFLEDLF